MHKNREKEMVVLGILTALAVLLSYVFAIQTPFVRITFGFLPLALAGALYGPWKAGLVGALDNLIGTALVGTSIFFPGFVSIWVIICTSGILSYYSIPLR